ncbi:hypothetical protein ED733_006286 [Metarhizium rileyi]|uniref:Uncharacterized protein n=1 Tax=Metarhizium rileyi (strain RCEF 4871) TaxID=1649241 RepID=A0A5C6GDV4_METRR|nr:hypothetical protein ED733_006286 [Metarhizium rileyi]
MAPETRSHGVPPSSRVYNSSPALQQVQFPARRKKIRRYGRSGRPSLKQQTLTQIDFVSSFDDGSVINLSDSDDEVKGADDGGTEDKENENPSSAGDQRGNAQEDEDKDNEGRVPGRRKRAASSGRERRERKKRRRTTGDETQDSITPREEGKSRRKTLGDVPASSSYHTQTLTQFLGHQTSFIADSDDEPDLGGDDADDGFLSWLGEPGSPSAGRGRRDIPSPAVKRRHEAASAVAASGAVVSLSREDSVIPQTPARRKTSIRFDLPSGGLRSPCERMIDRYGAPNRQDSPLTRPRAESALQTRHKSPNAARQASLVGEESSTTESWATPTKSQAEASQRREPTPRHVSFDTPSKPSSFGDESTPTKKPARAGGPYEIPDSDEDDDGFGEDGHGGEKTEEGYGAGAETQLVLSELASFDEPRKQGRDVVPSSTQTSRQDSQLQSTSSTDHHQPPIRNPLRHPQGHTQSTQTQSQLWESQRVPVSVLQSLPVPSARSDILLPISTASLDALVTGRTLHVITPFKIPRQVVRFWLFENNLLRYMASVEPGQPVNLPPSPGHWQFLAAQVYELNNPVCEDDMRQEGWVDGRISRYTYLPPAVVGQLLWNLRHALFRDAPDQQPAPVSPPPRDSKDVARHQLPSATPLGSMTVSQQITAQIHSDIASSTQPPTSDDTVPSTSDFSEPPQRPCSAKGPLPASASQQPPRTIWPSQATTLSQPLTPEKQSQPAASIPPPPVFHLSDNSVQFTDTRSLSSLPFPSSPSSTSQLLTTSQMLPESLTQDHAPPVPLEIWDSDEEDVSL